ncbi:hypothetical protein Tco_0153583 [Tanacetum coccineum]
MDTNLLGFLILAHPNNVKDRVPIDKTLVLIISNELTLCWCPVYVDGIIFVSTMKSISLNLKSNYLPIESNKPLVKDEDGVDVDVHEYRSMIGSLMYLTASRPDIMFAVCACARAKQEINNYLDINFLVEDSYLGSARSKQLWQILLLRQNMLQLLIAVGKISMDFEDDRFIKQFWQTATVRTLANGTQQLVASIDSKEYTITEASVRSKLQLADATGIHNLSDAEIYAGLATLGGYVPLLPAMLAGAAVDQGEGSAQPAEPHHTPVDPISSTSQPPLSPPYSPH